MPTYKNVSNEDVHFITGGVFKAGEAKTVADPIDSPSLQLVDDDQATHLAELDHPQNVLQGVEPETNQAVTEAQQVAEAPQVAPPAPQPVAQPEVTPQAPVAPVAPAPVAAPAPVQPEPQPNNVTAPGA
jgi:hypothetical protein